MADYWLENAADPGTHTLIDLGYVKDQATRDRADRLLAVVGRSNLQFVAYGRLLLRVPPTKVAAVLARFPDVRPADERPGYSWCTHTWLKDER